MAEDQKDPGTYQGYAFILALKPAILIGAIVFWIGGVFLSMKLDTHQGRAKPGLIAALQCLLFFGASLSLFFSAVLREKVFREDVSLAEISGPYWVITLILGGLGSLFLLQWLGWIS